MINLWVAKVEGEGEERVNVGDGRVAHEEVEATRVVTRQHCQTYQ